MSVTELPSAPTGRTRNRPRRTPKGRQIDPARAERDRGAARPTARAGAIC